MAARPRPQALLFACSHNDSRFCHEGYYRAVDDVVNRSS